MSIVSVPAFTLVAALIPKHTPKLRSCAGIKGEYGISFKCKVFLPILQLSSNNQKSLILTLIGTARAHPIKNSLHQQYRGGEQSARETVELFQQLLIMCSLFLSSRSMFTVPHASTVTWVCQVSMSTAITKLEFKKQH